MEGKLSADLLKAHNANLRSENMPQTRATGAGSMSSSVPRIALAKDKMHQEKSDKHSESSSKLSSGLHAKDKFSRLRSKMRLHTLLGGALSRSKTGSEMGKGSHRTIDNTYKTEPDKETKFVAQRAEQIIKTVLTTYLKEKAYDGRKFPQLCKTLADLIKERVKMTGMRRFKVLAHVMILEDKEQSITYASRCLWDTNFDNYATATYHGSNFTAIGSVFAVYYD